MFASDSLPSLAGAAECVVGWCRKTEDPENEGRLQITWPSEDGELQSQWLGVLEGLSVAAGDRVLLLTPRNSSASLVVGVLARPATAEPSAQVVRLADDRPVRVEAPDGQTLLEISQGPDGVQVRLPDADVHLDTPGKLAWTAESVAITSRTGDVEIQAAEDVVARGQFIRLN